MTRYGHGHLHGAQVLPAWQGWMAEGVGGVIPDNHISVGHQLKVYFFP